jgi:hypothetical protein
MLLIAILLPEPNAVSLAVILGRVTGVLKGVVALSSCAIGGFGIFVGVFVGVCVVVGVFVGVCEGVAVAVGVLVGVFVGVSVGVLVGVFVGVSVGVFVGVFVAVPVGVFVGVSVGVLVAVSVGVVDGVFVSVLVGVSVGVFVSVLVAVLVGVFVGVFVEVLVGVLVGVFVGVRTLTVFEPVLLASLLSVTLLFGSTVAVLARLPTAVGMTGTVMLKEAPAGRVTAPLATQLKAVPATEQLIVPVGGVLPFVTVSAPCG